MLSAVVLVKNKESKWIKAYREQLEVDLPFIEKCSLKEVTHSLDPRHDSKNKTKVELIPEQRMPRNI